LEERKMKTLILVAPIQAQVLEAKKLGIRTISFWDRAGASGSYLDISRDVRETSDEYYEMDLTNATELVAQLREHLCTASSARQKGSKVSADRAEVFFGGMDQYYPTYTAAMRELGREKNSAATVQAFQNKSVMRNLLEKDEQLRIGCTKADSVHELRAALEKCRFPVIIKPTVSFGSKNILLIRNEGDASRARNFWSAQGPFSVLIEDFFEGPQFSIEAISFGGRHEILGITEKFPVIAPHFVETGGIFPAQISLEAEKILIAATLKLLQLAQVQEGATHTEIILSGKRPIVVESHLRAGGLIPFLIQGAYQVSFYRMMILALFDQWEPYDRSRARVSILSILLFEYNRTLESIGGRAELKELDFVHMHNVWVKPGQKLIVPQSNLDRHGYIVVSGEDLKSAYCNLAHAVALLKPVYQKEVNGHDYATN
jgi:biotin carboxylase